MNFSKGKGYSKKDIVESGTPFIRYGSLYTNFEIEITNIKESVEENSKSVKSKGGEILIPSSGETPSEIARASTLLKKDVIIGGDINILTVKNNNVLPTFLALDLNTNRNSKELSKYAVGNSVVHLYNKDLHRLKIYLPDIETQKQIVRIWRTLDKLLTLHNLKKKKIEKLKLDLIKRLDFSLTEESDEVFLGDFIEIKSGYGFKSEEFSNYGIPLVRISDIDSGIVKKPDTFIKEASKHIDFIIKNGDYLIAMSGATTGKVGRYTLSHDAYCNQRIGIIRGIENKIDNNYLEYVLHTSKFQHYISTQWGAGAQPNINLKQIKDYKLRLPKLSEQKLIGSIFASLNSQKNLHKVKIDQLLALKELYLNKLFL